ncbi:hypothetical protein Rhopal_004355-T1 [Rhodotorula paludigena]|uniref:Uncharacterized protein n=1 Tax=Rhodotorula paludigena TaxID=86838 RepID=A0AAV5GN29_9BASI|nr:hypothetical protein Rhopal_004355-T1 [Rhodotorula paludigena]
MVSQDQILDAIASPAPLAADLRPFEFWRHVIRNFCFHMGSWLPINTFFHEECKRLFPQATAFVAMPTRMSNPSSTPSFNRVLSYNRQISTNTDRHIPDVHLQLVADSDTFDSLLLSVFNLDANVWILGGIMQNLRNPGGGETKRRTTNKFYRGAKQMLVAASPAASAGALTRTPARVRPTYVAFQPKPYPLPNNLLLDNFAQKYGYTPSTVGDKGYFVFGLPFCKTKLELCCLNYTTLDQVTYLSFEEILNFQRAQRRQDKVPNKDCLVNQGMLQPTAALARAHAKMLGWPTDALINSADMSI